MQIVEDKIFSDRIVGISPFNVRQHLDPIDDLSALKATIRAVGVINRIVVHPDRHNPDDLLVLDGGRRWRAVCDLVNEGFPIPGTGDFDSVEVKIVEEATDAELLALSTMQSVTPLAMHPVQQYEAFAAIAHAMPSEAQAIDAISREFGLTRQHVRQRLALGNLSPKIRAAWLAGEIGAETAKAYAGCDDIAAQEAFFDHPDNRVLRTYPANVRRALLADFRSANEAIVRFVGETAYRQAGGVVRESLFDEERLFSGALISKLGEQKLAAEGVRRCQDEGWGFLIRQGDAGEDDFEQIDDFAPDYLAEEDERARQIAELINHMEPDATVAGAPGHEKADALFAELDAIEAKATMRAFSAKERIGLGIFVGFNHLGRLTVTRALQSTVEEETVGPTDDESPTDDTVIASGAKQSTAASAKPAPSESSKLAASEPIGKQLRAVLEETLAGALHAVTSRSVNLALIYAVATLGCSYDAHVVDLTMHARRGWTPSHPLLRDIAHERFDKALTLCAAAPLADLTVAFCELIAAAIDPSRVAKIEDALRLVRAAPPLVGMEAALRAQFNADLYFHASSREAMTTAIREIDGEAASAEAGKLGKPALRERATVLAQDRGWLPPVLAEAATFTPAPVVESETKPATDTRTTAEAMLDAIAADEGEPAPIQEWHGIKTVADFVAAHIRDKEGAFVDAGEMLNLIDAYCKRHSRPILSVLELEKQLAEHAIHPSMKGAVSGFKNVRVFDAIKLCSDAPDPKAAIYDAISSEAVEGSVAGVYEPEPKTNVERVNRFIIDRCQTGLSARGDIKASVLGAAYDAWAKERGWPPISGNHLSLALGVIGVEKHRLGKGVHYKNLSLREQYHEQNFEAAQ